MNDLEFLLSSQLNLLDVLWKSTRRIEKFLANENIDALEFETKNRDRILLLLREEQSKIDAHLQISKTKASDDYESELIASWACDIQGKLSEIENLERAIENNLSALKGKIGEEIGRLSRGRKKIASFKSVRAMSN